MFKLEKRRLRRNLMALYNCLEGRCHEVVMVFYHVPGERIRGNGLKLHWEKFRLDTEIKFFTESG